MGKKLKLYFDTSVFNFAFADRKIKEDKSMEEIHKIYGRLA